jgi:hypothetical protein
MKADDSLTDGDDLRLHVRSAVPDPELEQIESGLGVSAGFVKALLDEPSDWGFLIKLAVVVEAALAQVICDHIGIEQIGTHVDKLPIGGRTGKIQMAADLNLIGSATQARLNAIAALRNAFAHRIDVVELSLEQHIATLPSEEAVRIAQRLLTTDEKPAVLSGFDGYGMRHIVWAAACLCLLELSRVTRLQKSLHEIRRAHELMGEAFVLEKSGRSEESKAKLFQARELLEAAQSRVPLQGREGGDAA